MYLLTDNFILMVFQYFLVNKSDFPKVLRKVISKTKSDGFIIRKVRSDNAREFVSTEVAGILCC